MSWNMPNSKRVGCLLVLAGAWWNHLETAYFGFNMYPATVGEFAADIISMIVVVVGLILLCWKTKQPPLRGSF